MFRNDKKPVTEMTKAEMKDTMETTPERFKLL